MNGAVAERRREGGVHAAMLIQQREPVELGARNRHLEVVAGSRTVLDFELGGARKRLFEERVDRLGFHLGAMLATVPSVAMRIFRVLGLTTLGAFAGFAGAAVVMKRVLQSRGDSTSSELALVAIFDGIELSSRANPFSGGSMLTWFGGIAVDLREAKLAPDAHLSLHAVLGGIAIRVPPGWRVESNVHAIGGGVAVDAPDTGDADASRLVLDGFTLLGGVSVGAKAYAADPAS